MSKFKLNEIKDQKGKIAIVTGSNTGLGYETALELARKNFKVIMACRNLEKANDAKQKIITEINNADLEIIQIDLSDLNSVRNFVNIYLEKYNKIDLLINNAGVMIPPYSKTVDGFELQMGANHFGHFLLTGLLLETLNNTEKSRIISLSSNAHKMGKINFEDIHWEKKYTKMGAYAQSKLACLMFAYELQRRLEKNNHNTISVAAHPGGSDTDLARHLPSWLVKLVKSTVINLVTQKADQGALPTLMAALDENVKGGEYFGPNGFQELKGPPVKVKSTHLSHNKEVAKKLWETSEELTGIKYL